MAQLVREPLTLPLRACAAIALRMDTKMVIGHRMGLEQVPCSRWRPGFLGSARLSDQLRVSQTRFESLVLGKELILQPVLYSKAWRASAISDGRQKELRHC